MKDKILKFIKKNPILFLFASVVIIRTLLLFVFPLVDHSGGDFSFYSNLAQSLLSGDGFGGEVLAPMFSFYLALLYFFFGTSVFIVMGGQVLLGGLLVIGVYFLAEYIFEKRVALFAGVITVLWPPFLIETFLYGGNLLLYSVLLIFSLFFFIRALFESRILFALFSGILLAAAALTDSIALYMPFVILLWVLLLFIFRKKIYIFSFTKKHIIVLSVFLVVFIGTIAPWTYRNAVVLGGFSEAPLVVNQIDKRFFTEDIFGRLLYPFSPQGWGVLGSGLGKMFIFPHNISVLDTNTDISYKEVVGSILENNTINLSPKEWFTFSAKSIITIFHWLLLMMGFVGLMLGRSREFSLFVIIIIIYTASLSIGYGSLWNNNFQSISLLSSFLSPLIPFIIIFSSVFLVTILYDRKLPLLSKLFLK